MKTKLFTLFLALAASVGTMFAEKVQIGDLYYDLDATNKTAKVTYKSESALIYNKDWNISTANIPASITINGKTYTVTSIGGSAFQSCTSLTSVTIPNSVTSIGGSAFQSCTSLIAIEIPNSITSIDSDAFSECRSLTSVEIPNSVTRIGTKTFSGCSGLTSAKIGSGVTYIGREAFFSCRNLTEVTIEATTPPTLRTDYSNQVFDYYVQSFYVPCGSLEAYKSDWSVYQSKIKYKPSLYTITAVKTEGGHIAMPEELTICDENVQITATPDKGCYFVRWADGNTDNPRTIELTQDTTMEAIFDYLLTGKCGKDSVLTWKFDPSTMALDIMGQGALSENYTYGSFIKSLTIGNEITQIGEEAFYRFEKLENVILGSSVKVLELAAFSRCSSIKTITCYSQRPPTVNNYALYGLDYSTIVYVPADYLNTYKMHDAWGLYDVRPLGAETTETTEVKVTPTDNTATIVWPAVNDAATYELVIKDKNGNVICTLIFNANGQLTQIVFGAPSRAQSAGFSFTVTGLEEGTDYDLTITAKNAGGNEIDKKSLSFHTGSSTAIEDILVDDKKVSKFFHNGQIYLRRAVGDRDVKVYTITGQEVR